MIHNKGKRPKRTSPLWMVTYADMVTLILVFFILLFSMSHIDAVKFKAVAESYQQKVIFDFFPSPIPLDQSINVEEKEDESDIPISEEENEDEKLRDDSIEEESFDEQQQLLEEVEQFLEEENLSSGIMANESEDGVVLIIQEQVLFESARAELVEEAIPFLDKVGKLLESIPNPVRVEGHTDSVPINTLQFPSNWELSGARASSVVRYFTEELTFDASRFQIAGYSDTKPVIPSEGAERLNRRVEIVLLVEQK